MNENMKCTTVELEVFPDDEITAVRAVDSSLDDLKNYENKISTMPVKKLRNQVNQLSRQVTLLREEIPDGEPDTDWEREKIQLLDLAIAKKQIAQTYLSSAEES